MLFMLNWAGKFRLLAYEGIIHVFVVVLRYGHVTKSLNIDIFRLNVCLIHAQVFTSLEFSFAL